MAERFSLLDKTEWALSRLRPRQSQIQLALSRRTRDMNITDLFKIIFWTRSARQDGTWSIFSGPALLARMACLASRDIPTSSGPPRLAGLGSNLSNKILKEFGPAPLANVSIASRSPRLPAGTGSKLF